MSKKWDAIWYNGTIVTCQEQYGLIEQGAIATLDGKIAWLGSASQLDAPPTEQASLVYDLHQQCLTPGFIDCHTHIIYAGDRAHEFEWRLQGKSYEDIAKDGGGIQSTVATTRHATEEELFTQSIERVKTLQRSGVTTLEIKSGYGLDWQTEYKMLRVADRIAQSLPITIKKTFLGAHTLPKEFHNKSEAYIKMICDEMIPRIAQEQLADAVDVFCEKIAFNLLQTEKIFQTAKQYGLNIKCHAEQLSHSGSAALAAQYQALSVDHLEFLSLADCEKIAKAKTVAVLLPGAFYFLRDQNKPPIHHLRESHIPIALATDCNPGTSPILSLLIILNLACTLFCLTPEEVLLGVTIHAARALGLAETHGSLQVGKVADFAIWNVNHPRELAYYLGNNPLTQLVKEGKNIQF